MTDSFDDFRVIQTPARRPGAVTLLLIHGFLDDAAVWDEFVDALDGEVTSVSYDLPGFGTRSGSVAEARAATLESLAAEAGEIMSAIPGPVIVVGQSLGTQVAELVAAQHADRVPGLVLLTPIPLGGTRLPDEAIAPMRAVGGDRDAQRAERAALAPNMGAERLERLTETGMPVASDVVAHFVDVWNNGVAEAPIRSAYDGPVLIVRGGADGLTTEQLVDTITPRFGHVEVHVIDTGGHWLHVEHPGTVAAMVLDFTDAVMGVSS
ncbi:alpha/beta hydrolase [Mycolicibacterium mucogenicum]|uniref:alpha/beta fold hydrolase n=1 Tax=Mycolicibacterium mucogenicum TaxID=56689 RepID=UPI00226AD4D2|nr:alpha/beta hydrolase [Mycolicibacterium mucogenicum]MCX8564601.1 alpha/beta hydrolase [Mycolicibacterium mucogenicum]